MHTAVTLVHKGAMPIALHAVSTFARHFTGQYRLRIHSDGSLDTTDEDVLLQAARAMPAEIVRPAGRETILQARTAAYPKTRELLTRGAYFTKLQLPVCEEIPYFYFDSDIVWLSPVSNLMPLNAPNAFSTESWSWYFGMADEAAWIRDQVPRRVNSGFYHLGEEFPFARMEEMLEKGLFDPSLPDNTDQEVMAYLFRNMEHYHPEDLKRTRVGKLYSLCDESCAALHFPGRMWRRHMDQVETLDKLPPRQVQALRYNPPVPLSRFELLRMRAFIAICNLRCIQKPLNAVRKLRNLSRN